jgi:S-(hydroxymethyl)glutathione dehydrogenase/alcohol dehydrogenase
MKKLKILGAILEKHNSPLKFKNLDVPKLNHGQLLIKMAYTGVCKSQLMEITGGRNNKIFIPHLLGHEGSGTVIDRHKSVTKLKLGDEVICSWLGTRGAKSDKIVYYDVNRKINAGPITTFSTYSIIS